LEPGGHQPGAHGTRVERGRQNGVTAPGYSGRDPDPRPCADETFDLGEGAIRELAAQKGKGRLWHLIVATPGGSRGFIP